MPKKLATCLIVILIAIVFVLHMFQRRDNFECLVMAQTDRYRLMFDEGVATDQEVRDAVWVELVAEYHNHTWRAHLDNVYHGIFMGGNRAQQVLNRLRNSTENAPWYVNCEGGIRWNIWALANNNYQMQINSKDGKSVHDVSVALRAIPKDELSRYIVSVFIYTDIDTYGGGLHTYIKEWRRVGGISADDWLSGHIVPESWSAFHTRLQARIEKH